MATEHEKELAYEEFCLEQAEYYKCFLERVKNNEVDNCCEMNYYDKLNIDQWNHNICLSCRGLLINDFVEKHRKSYVKMYSKKRVIRKKN